MDDALRQALDPVLRDLDRAGLVLPRLEDRPWAPGPGVLSVVLVGADGSSTGVSVPLDATAAERVALAADQVQEWVVEDQLWRAGATAWPSCPAPRHTHPTRAVAADGVAAWACPVSGEVVAPVGGL